MKQTTKQILLGATIVVIYTTFGLRVKDRLRNTDEVQLAPRMKNEALDKSTPASFELLLDYPGLFTAPKLPTPNSSKPERGQAKPIKSIEKKKTESKVAFPTIKGIVKADYKLATVYVEVDGVSQRRSIGDTIGTGLTIADISTNSIHLTSLPAYVSVDTLLYVGQGDLK